MTRALSAVAGALRRRRTDRALVTVAAAALGVAAADAARRAPEFSLAGDSVARVALGVATGWALVAAGLALRAGGGLLVTGGLAWLASGLGTPGAPGPLLFTVGLVAAAAAPALIGHALLTVEGGLRRPLDRAAVGALYATAALLGPLAALVFDATGCGACPANLLYVAEGPDPTASGIRFGAVAIAGTVVLALWRLARAPAARRARTAPIVVPGGAYLAVVAAALVHAWERGYLGLDATDRALWTAQAAALLGVAAGVTALRLAARRRRGRVARLVIELADTRRSGGMRDALAQLLGDPNLELLYADGAGAWIDASGRERTPPTGKAATQLVRDQEPLALLCHRPGLLDDPRLAAELERSARLGLEHERLQGRLRRQLEHLRRSRAAVVAAGEAERRLLERDLHDGAQQRLVAFAFSLGIARRQAAPERAAALEQARSAVLAALAELRELAHGLYPVALAEAGLPAAVESLRDRRPGLRADLPAERFPPAVEETAYFAIASLTDLWTPLPVTLAAARDDGRLVLELRSPGRAPIGIVDIEDRVGALGGALAIDGANRATQVRLELPCA
jgi:signal transduction histidine kinase